MNYKSFLLVGLGAITGLTLIVIVVMYLLQGTLSIDRETQTVRAELRSLEQRDQYNQRQREFVATQQIRQVRAVIGEYLKIAIMLCIPVIICAGALFFAFSCQKRFAPVLTYTDAERQVTTRIPILPETLDERLYIAQAAPLRSLALAKHDMNAQGMEYVKTIALAMKAMNTGHSRTIREDELCLPAAEEEESHEKTLAQLLNDGELTPGHPILMGYVGGQPEFREPESFKVMAVTGEQGSGKTWSIAFFVGEMIGQAGYQVHICDPHRGHAQSLSTRLGAFIKHGLIQEVNPFDVHKTIATLDATLNRRLNGQEPSTPGILLVLEEFNRIAINADPEHFTTIIDFLTRCTTETRKANIMFVGMAGSWHARFFKGRADIRRAMNSALVHNCHPDSAKMVLKDTGDLKKMAQLKRPRRAMLATDYADTKIVTMPFCRTLDFDAWTQQICADRQERGNAPIMVQAREVVDGKESASTGGKADEENGKGLSKKVREYFKGNMDAARQMLFPDMKAATFSSKWYGSRDWNEAEAAAVRDVLASV